MKIGMMYAMDGEIESLLKNENAHLIEKVSGAPFYQMWWPVPEAWAR